MLLKNRPFRREKPSREAKVIYIFAEGVKREAHYFKYFKEIDSRINIEIYPLKPNEPNHPLGLLELAKHSIIPSEANPNPKYAFLEGDEVWIVLDTEDYQNLNRHEQIQQTLLFCNNKAGWNLARSNPCFEVWLYYHFCSMKPNIEGGHVCSPWKQLVANSVSGGFNSRIHPILIADAIRNASNNFTAISDIGNTEVFHLANMIFSFVKKKIQNV